MAGSPSATPLRGRHEMLDEALDLVETGARRRRRRPACRGSGRPRPVRRRARLPERAPRPRPGRAATGGDQAPGHLRPPRLRGEPPRPPGERRRSHAGVPALCPRWSPGAAPRRRPSRRVPGRLPPASHHQAAPAAAARSLHAGAVRRAPREAAAHAHERDRRPGRRHAAAGRRDPRGGDAGDDRAAVPGSRRRARVGSVPRRHQQPGARDGGSRSGSGSATGRRSASGTQRRASSPRWRRPAKVRAGGCVP